MTPVKRLFLRELVFLLSRQWKLLATFYHHWRSLLPIYRDRHCWIGPGVLTAHSPGRGADFARPHGMETGVPAEPSASGEGDVSRYIVPGRMNPLALGFALLSRV